jgi:hypothetical protein
MKLLISNNKIVGTATDEYTGPLDTGYAPEDFDIQRMEDYEVVNGYAVLKVPPFDEMLAAGTQLRLDQFAQTRMYDSILSACTYSTSAVSKFQVEGQYCVQIRDLTWEKISAIIEEVNQGIREIPTTFSEIEPELPVLEWPI